jgi:negative regulator of sigma-B (phosphoserine phosphatase)
VKLVIDHLTLPRDGEVENGDAVVVREDGDGHLIAVIDALGHGPLAADVARTAVEHLTTAPLKGGVGSILDRLHLHLWSSRGAAAMVCSFRQGRLEGCGVGNVEMRTFGTRVPSVLTPGVLGRGQLRLRLFEATLAPGDGLIIFSDGILSRFDTDAMVRMPLSQACRALMDNNRRPHDDATVLIARVEP